MREGGSERGERGKGRGGVYIQCGEEVIDSRRRYIPWEKELNTSPPTA